MIGKQILQYKILEKLGEGGMGVVYKAHDTKLKRDVAIKFLPQHIAAREEERERFKIEAQAAAALNHPNIATIYNIEEHDDELFIVMEYIEGRELRETVAENPPEALSLRGIVDVAIQIASGLQAAHEKGVIHRDIKSSNIMITDKGQVKIMDFGLAKVRGGAKVTKLGTTLGTAAYMSPEQARGEEADERSDVWAFGVVLYEMLTAEMPFPGDYEQAVIYSILNEEPEFSDKIPENLRRILQKTLAKKRDERYQIIEEVLADLNSLSSGTKSVVGKPARTSGHLRLQRNRWFFSGGLAALLLLAGFAYFVNRSQPIESIAVMPFVNASGNADFEYLSDGMTETLISSLSRLPKLNVKPRSSVFRYKGKETNPQTIAKELNVQAVLNGRVVQRGQNVSLFVELIDVGFDKVVWSQQYNRKQMDIVRLQTDIARDVSSQIKTKLSGVDEEKVTKTSTVNSEAYQAYLKGRFYWNKLTRESLKKAIEQFKVALEKDPNYALAYVGLADSYGLANQLLSTPISESLTHVKTYADKALELDDSLGEAYSALGLRDQKLWNWAESEKNYKRAIELSPNYPDVRRRYSHLLGILGRNDEALAEIKRAIDHDPLSSIFLLNVSLRYQEMGDYESALEQIKKIIEINPGFPTVHWRLAEIYLDQRRSAEALVESEKARDFPWSAIYFGRAYAQQGRRKDALAIIEELEKRSGKGEEAASLYIAKIYAELGDKDKTFTWLEKAFQVRDERLPWIRTELVFKPLRDDPRYKDLLTRMNLPE